MNSTADFILVKSMARTRKDRNKVIAKSYLIKIKSFGSKAIYTHPEAKRLNDAQSKLKLVNPSRSAIDWEVPCSRNHAEDKVWRKYKKIPD